MPSSALSPRSNHIRRPKICAPRPIVLPPVTPPPPTSCAFDSEHYETGPDSELAIGVWGFTDLPPEPGLEFYLYCDAGHFEPVTHGGVNDIWLYDTFLWFSPSEPGDYTLTLVVIWEGYATCETSVTATVTEES